MRRLAIAALAAFISGNAYAVCPSTITDCPFPIFNGITSAANINMLDNKALVFSTDGTKSIGYQSSNNAVVLTNSILLSNFGFATPADQPWIFNNPTNTAVVNYDSGIGRLRIKNVPLQVDGSLYLPGGNAVVAGSLSVGNGATVIGAYSGTSDPALTFANATFSGGAAAVVLGDNSALQLSTAASGFSLASNTVTGKVALTYGGSPVFTVDQSGNATFSGSLTQAGTFVGLATFNAGILLTSGSMVISSTTGTLIQTAGSTATAGLDMSATTFSGNTFNDGHVSFSGAGDILLNSATTLPTATTVGLLHLPHVGATPTGVPTNTTPGCVWNTVSHTLNCYDGSAWFHSTFSASAA